MYMESLVTAVLPRAEFKCLISGTFELLDPLMLLSIFMKVVFFAWKCIVLGFFRGHQRLKQDLVDV